MSCAPDVSCADCACACACAADVRCADVSCADVRCAHSVSYRSVPKCQLALAQPAQLVPRGESEANVISTQLMKTNIRSG